MAVFIPPDEPRNFSNDNMWSSSITCGTDANLKFSIDVVRADPRKFPQAAGKANSFYNPLGPSPAVGYFLVMQDSIEKIVAMPEYGTRDDTGEKFAAIFNWKVKSNKELTIKGMTLLWAKKVTPAIKGAAYLCKIVDNRWLCANRGKANAFAAGAGDVRNTAPLMYNVRAPAPPITSDPMSQDANFYYSSSLDSGAVWTWQRMVADLWGKNRSLGTFSQLPDTFLSNVPAKKPEGFRFDAESVYDALNSVLELLNLAIAFDPQTGLYSIVDLTVEQDGANTLIKKNTPNLMDCAPYRSILTSYNNVISVRFHRLERHYGTEPTVGRDSVIDAWQSHPVYSRDFTLSDSKANGLVYAVWDDMPAIIEADGTIQNSSDLETRAVERKIRILAQWKNADRLSHVIFPGVVPDFTCGSFIKAVSWHDFGDGWKTEIVGDSGLRAERADAELLDDSGYGCDENIRGPDFARHTFPNQTPQVHVVRATSGTKNDSGFFPGIVRRLIPPVGGQEDVTCWIYAPGASAISTSDYYLGKLYGSAADSADARPVFFVQQFGATLANFVTVTMPSDYAPGATISDCAVDAVYPTGSGNPGSHVDIRTATFTGSSGDSADAFLVSPPSGGSNAVYRMVSHTPPPVVSIPLGDGMHGTQDVLPGY